MVYTLEEDKTQFPRSYIKFPILYHKFSLAEDVMGEIFRYIKKNCFKRTILLDIGCGTGKYTIQLSSFFKTIIGIDPSRPALELAQNIANKRKIKNVIFIEGRGEAIPLPSKSVDAILLTWVTIDPNIIFKEMKRVLRKGGIIIRISPHVKDELTSLFPNFDIKPIEAKNNWFKKMGFKSEIKEIIIKFKSENEKCKIMKKVIGVNRKVFKNRIKHSILIQ